jgi:hypothetical protein
MQPMQRAGCDAPPDSEAIKPESPQLSDRHHAMLPGG